MATARMLFAAFRNEEHADMALHQLEEHDIIAKDISVISKEREHVGPAGGTAAGVVGGATTGGVLGGIAGFLAGAGVIPALAGFLIGGPIAAALGLTGVAAATVSGVATGAAVGGVAGGLIGALTGLGLSHADAEHYERTISEGGLLLVIPVTGKNESQVRHLLEANHAEQLRVIDMDARRHAAMQAHRTHGKLHRSQGKNESEHRKTQAAKALGKASR